MATATLTKASDKQVAFIKRLAAERSTAGLVCPNNEYLASALTNVSPLSVKEASTLITALLACPKIQAPVSSVSTPKAEPVEVGVYVLASDEEEDRIVKVQASKQDKSRRYAKIWREINAERALETGGRVHGDWFYAPGVISEIKPEHAMNKEQACEFGVRYGRCVRCGRHLEAAKSVEQAIGPVCIKYFHSYGKEVAA